MRLFYCILVLLCLNLFSCQTIKVNPSACLTTQHHQLVIGSIDVYVKYWVDEFPGYTDFSIYDQQFLSDERDGSLCISGLPLGKHWIAGYGFDETILEYVKGAVQVEITADNPNVEFILYVGEE